MENSTHTRDKNKFVSTSFCFWGNLFQISDFIFQWILIHLFHMKFFFEFLNKINQLLFCKQYIVIFSASHYLYTSTFQLKKSFYFLIHIYLFPKSSSWQFILPKTTSCLHKLYFPFWASNIVDNIIHYYFHKIIIFFIIYWLVYAIVWTPNNTNNLCISLLFYIIAFIGLFYALIEQLILSLSTNLISIVSYLKGLKQCARS